jgi:CheY-like chemotaxis protein
MKEKEIVLFIDDERVSRALYTGTLQDIYGEEYSVVAIEPGETIKDMLQSIDKFERVVAIVIDEKLHVEVGTDYKGSDLVMAIRLLDVKLPLYILTSEMGLIEPPFGSVEYIIDKSKVEQPSYKEECSLLMRRHINSFNEIKSERAERFDALLRKSIDEELSAEEAAEYAALDFLRVRQVLTTEAILPSTEFDKQEELLAEIESKLKKMDGE